MKVFTLKNDETVGRPDSVEVVLPSKAELEVYREALISQRDFLREKEEDIISIHFHYKRK
ncbi:hypothetical protein KKF82_06075 [Patescibacteria group bacterium]|nr:hypothetical protein [Patescibacteria group bacterium]